LLIYLIEEKSIIRAFHREILFTTRIVKYPTTEDIIRAGLSAFEISMDELRVKSRKRMRVGLRQAIQYMCYRMKTDSLKKIALKTGVDSHATILHSYRLIGNHVAIYGNVADVVRKLEKNMFYAGLNTGPVIEMADPIDWYDPDIRKTENGKIPIKITNVITGDTMITDSINEARRLCHVKHYKITNICNGYKGQRGFLEFTYG